MLYFARRILESGTKRLIVGQIILYGVALYLLGVVRKRRKNKIYFSLISKTEVLGKKNGTVRNP